VYVCVCIYRSIDRLDTQTLLYALSHGPIIYIYIYIYIHRGNLTENAWRIYKLCIFYA
jgi:hypothetical protein